VLSNRVFDDIAEADLVQLIGVVGEGLLIDYKRDAYGRSDADVKEFLKDVSSFANTSGGHIVIGMSEEEGVASSLSPLRENVDQELQRLENLVRDGIEPRIVGIRMKAVPILSGGYAVVIRVPRSWNTPHRVSARNTNRFYGRSSAGAYELSIPELRGLFLLAPSLQESVRNFRDDRLARVAAGRGSAPLLAHPGTMILHVVPVSAFANPQQIDLNRAMELQESLRPMGTMGFTPRLNFDGFVNLRGAETPSLPGYTQLFRNGIIEAVRVGILREHEKQLLLPSIPFERYPIEVIPMYLDALRGLEIAPPVILMITLLGMEGSVLGVSNEENLFDPPPPFDRSKFDLPEIVIEEYGSSEDYIRAVRPAFDAMWNAAGRMRSPHFDESGLWVGSKKRR
jgi:hypothetical protein